MLDWQQWHWVWVEAVSWQASVDRTRLIGHMILHRHSAGPKGDLGFKVVGGRRALPSGAASYPPSPSLLLPLPLPLPSFYRRPEHPVPLFQSPWGRVTGRGPGSTISMGSQIQVGLGTPLLFSRPSCPPVSVRLGWESEAGAGRLGAFITRVKRNSVADLVGQLKPGDEVLEWNGRVLQGSHAPHPIVEVTPAN